MTYKIKGYKVILQLSAEEIGQIIASLELTDPDGELIETFKQFRKEEFA